MTNTQNLESLVKKKITRDYDLSLESDISLDVDHSQEEIVLTVATTDADGTVRELKICVSFSGFISTIRSTEDLETTLSGVEVKVHDGDFVISPSQTLTIKKLG